MIEIKETDLLNVSKEHLKDWRIVLESSHNSTIFHSSQWVKVLMKWTDSKGKLLLAYVENQPVGVFHYYPRKNKKFLINSVSTIFESPYGGPISVNDEDGEIVRSLLSYVEKKLFVNKISIVLPPFTRIKIFREMNFNIESRETMLIRLNEDNKTLFNQMHKMKIRNIKKAEKSNLRIVHERIDGIKCFHEMLTSTYERLQLTPPKPIKFYEDLFTALKPNNNMILSVVYYNEHPVSSAIFLLFNESVIFWQGASYKEYMKFGGNDLLHWDIMKYGNSIGMKYYNLLHFHDGKGIELDSLRRFKEGFGAKIEPYHLVQKNTFI